MTLKYKALSIVIVAVGAVWLSGNVFATVAPDIGSEQGSFGSDTTLLIAYILLALISSFLCSIAEAVLLSVTPSFIESIKDERPRRAMLLKKLKQDNIDQSLAVILTLNTIAHTVGAIGAGAKAAVVFGDAWLGIFSALMTLMILFLSEIVPKTIGAIYWRGLAFPTAFFVKGLVFLLYPIVWLSEKITRIIAGKKVAHVFSKEEIMALARVGEEGGFIHQSESQIIHNLFRLDVVQTTDIMTPRTVMAALPEDIEVKTVVNYVSHVSFSRLPVYRADIDDITGFVLKSDILQAYIKGNSAEKVATLKRPILVVPEVNSLSILLENLLNERQHIAIVVDEYGGTKGLVTLEDVIETLVGTEIVDETDSVEDMRELARKKSAKRAELLGLKQPKFDEHQQASTNDESNQHE